MTSHSYRLLSSTSPFECGTHLLTLSPQDQPEGGGRSVPAENPSTGRLVSSLSCLRRSKVLDGLDICWRENRRKADGGSWSSVPGNEILALLCNHVRCSPPYTKSHSFFVPYFASTAMAFGATDNGDGEWMRVNDTHWRGLGLTDPIKNIEASSNKLPSHHWLNLCRINGCYCPPFSR